MSALLEAAEGLRTDLRGLRFSAPVTHVYNPLEYAWDLHRQYLERFGAGEKRVLFLGMNPGPWGMAQTGVPFGEIPAVRDWMGLRGAVGHPEPEHPKRPIDGLDCARSEVSGRRLWGLFAQRYPRADDFFAQHFVANFCPLVWMEESGRNRTPDKIPTSEMGPVTHACQRHLRRVIAALQPRWLVGVGGFAQAQLTIATDTMANEIPGHLPAEFEVMRVLHPSPASPAANRGWAEAATKTLVEKGVWEA
ncbi:MAG: uracil-DNA glycosylase family protein [Verrucomicrobiota bacterium]